MFDALQRKARALVSRQLLVCLNAMLFFFMYTFQMMQKHSSALPFCFFIQDPDTFAFAWQKTGTSEGGSQLRCNYYPMISDLSKIKPGQIRCGEHTDYGGITLLFQDDVGGLEVRDTET